MRPCQCDQGNYSHVCSSHLANRLSPCCVSVLAFFGGASAGTAAPCAFPSSVGPGKITACHCSSNVANLFQSKKARFAKLASSKQSHACQVHWVFVNSIVYIVYCVVVFTVESDQMVQVRAAFGQLVICSHEAGMKISVFFLRYVIQVHTFYLYFNMKILSVILSFRSTFSTHKRIIYTYFAHLFFPQKDLFCTADAYKHGHLP
jgi:hypothetical protein